MLEQFDFQEDEIIQISAKTGLNVEQVLKAVVDKIDPPACRKYEKGEKEDAFRAFLFDARYIPNRGVACLIKVMPGMNFDFETLRTLNSFHTGKRYDIYDIGVV